MMPKLVFDAINSGGTEFEKVRATERFKALNKEGQEIVLKFVENLYLGKTVENKAILRWAKN